jgi:hypothetical protein
MEHSFFAEVIDPTDGSPEADGESGETGPHHLAPDRVPGAALSDGRSRPTAADGFSRFLLEGGNSWADLDDMAIVRGLNI